MEVLVPLFCHWSSCSTWETTAGVWMLGIAQGYGRPDSFSCFWRSEQVMNNNSLLCSATEKGQPGSHLALSSGTKLWLCSDVNSGPLALYKAESTASTAALKSQCCLGPSPWVSLPKPPRGVVVLTWTAEVCIKQMPSNHVPMELLKVLSKESTLQYLQMFVKVFWELAQRSTGSCVDKAAAAGLLKSKVLSLFPKGFYRSFGAFREKLLLSFLLKHIYTSNEKYKPANLNTCKHILDEARRQEAQQHSRQSSLSFITAASKAQTLQRPLCA